MALLCGMSTPSADERQALTLRARNQIPHDDDLRALVACLTPTQAAQIAALEPA